MSVDNSESIDTLYVRGMSNESNEAEDIWDDTVLNQAYDKALRMANAEVAKRIAMATNSKKNEVDEQDATAADKPKKKKDKHKTSQSKKKSTWKIGMPCRAVYEEDGLEYEAFLFKIIDDKDCIVKFLGYDNSEQVPISTLKPSLGNEERLRQVQAAMGEKDDDGFESHPGSGNEGSERATSPVGIGRPIQKKKKKPKKVKQEKPINGFHFPELPHLPMPNIPMMRNLGSHDMPLPPPPPPPMSLSDRADAEEQAVSSMLLSWYMTGYYTGLYQGMKRERQNRRKS